ncbi:hypothetical protein TNCV_3336501 [Trichonephila clavipes]|nr:hypothetical protein TNCV_3336501 [Trichonephila clavipes]
MVQDQNRLLLESHKEFGVRDAPVPSVEDLITRISVVAEKKRDMCQESFRMASLSIGCLAHASRGPDKMDLTSLSGYKSRSVNAKRANRSAPRARNELKSGLVLPDLLIAVAHKSVVGLADLLLVIFSLFFMEDDRRSVDDRKKSQTTAE